MIKYQPWTSMVVSSLQGLTHDAADPFVAWQSNLVDNINSLNADDFELRVFCPVNSIAPAADQAAYLYLVPWMYDGSLWNVGANFGTATTPTGSEGTAIISDPNTMKGPLPLSFKIGGQALHGLTSITALGGTPSPPDGWSLAMRDCTGGTFSSSCAIAYRALYFTNS